jgi:acetyl esterase/lipase
MASWQSIFIKRLIRMTWDKNAGPGFEAARLRVREARLSTRFARVPADIQVTRVMAGPVRAEWIEPAGAQFHRVIVYLHGGGYVMGSLDTHRNLVARLATAAGARALILNYRLAPEHPFPAALEDTLAAYRWLLMEGLDPAGIAFAGDQAGGGLALAAAMWLRDNRAPLPAALVTLSPWTDLAFGGRSILRNAAKDHTLSIEMLAYFAQSYLQGALPTNPLASPLYGKLAGLPPLLIHAGANEILRDDATRLGERALNAGLDVSVEIYADQPHAFQLFDMLPEAQASVARLGAYIKSRTVSLPFRMAAE